VCDEGLVRHMT